LIASLNEPRAPADSGELPLRWTELAEALGRCERRVRDDLARHAAPLGFSASQFSLLWACRQAPPAGLGQNELAAVLALSPAHVSAQVEHLRVKGLLIGHRKAPDRRRQVWQLTPEGNDQLEALLATLLEWASQLEEGVPSSSRMALTSLLSELSTALDRQSPQFHQAGAAL
jgi:DNA-binding MarR family transcriptional regulator